MTAELQLSACCATARFLLADRGLTTLEVHLRLLVAAYPLGLRICTKSWGGELAALQSWFRGESFICKWISVLFTLADLAATPCCTVSAIQKRADALRIRFGESEVPRRCLCVSQCSDSCLGSAWNTGTNLAGRAGNCSQDQSSYALYTSLYIWRLIRSQLNGSLLK